MQTISDIVEGKLPLNFPFIVVRYQLIHLCLFARYTTMKGKSNGNLDRLPWWLQAGLVDSDVDSSHHVSEQRDTPVWSSLWHSARAI